MEWFWIVGVLIVAAYNFVYWGAATYNLETGEKFTGWKRFWRFLGMGGGVPF